MTQLQETLKWLGKAKSNGANLATRERCTCRSTNNPTRRLCGWQLSCSGAELGTADGSHSLLSLPGEQVSLRFSLEGRLSESHLGRVFLRLKPFLISARRFSMMQPSFCGTKPFLTEKKGAKGRTRAHENHITACSEISSTVKEHSALHNLLIFPFSPFCLLDSSSASCFFLFSALAACSFRVLFSCHR